MSDTLYQYYEEELAFVRREGQEFAGRHPTAAGRLQLEPNRSVDPHVERLIESFSFLTARIRKKLDDEFPAITDALLNVLYPHYLAPIPSCAVLQFVPEPANVQVSGLEVARHSRLHTTKVGDVACQYRTCYPVTLWPLEVANVESWEPPFPDAISAPAGTMSAIRMQLRCQGDHRFDQLEMDSLRFYLCGDSRATGAVYELLFNHAVAIEHRSGEAGRGESGRLLAPDEGLRQVGIAADEGLIPQSEQSFVGYRLLSEVFSFPEKFLFFDLTGFRSAENKPSGRSLDVIVYLNCPLTGLEHSIAPPLFRLGCTPVVNLFEKIAEPVRLTHRAHRYRVTPQFSRLHGYEVYSIDRVYTADTKVPLEYRKLYDYRHASPWAKASEGSAFWYSSRVDSNRPDDRGTDMYLYPVDLNFDPAVDSEQSLVVRTTCTNRDLPVKLQHVGERLRFELESAVPLRSVRCLRMPTPPLRPPHRRHASWRLISHLALNHLSISGAGGRDALCEILRLYDFAEQRNTQQLAAVNRQWIEGIAEVRSRRVTRRIHGDSEDGICRGVEVTIDFDEEKYGASAFLFASVLERFLGVYASINSFVELVATTGNGSSLIKRWSPRAGELPLL